MNHRRLTLLVWLISVLAWGAVLLRILLIADKCQWDFEVYYYAAKAYSAGLNPYDPYNLCELTGRWAPQILFFPYFPVSIFLFEPFTLLSLEAAKYVFFFVKCGLLSYLFYLWQTKFLKNPSDPFFALFSLFAFNATIFLDIRSGNVSIIEQALIWSALVAFVSNRVWHFSVLISLAAVFKMTPLAFAGLLLLGRSPVKQRCLLIIVLGVIVVCFLTWLADPVMLGQFLLCTSRWTEGDRFFLNAINPSTLSLVKFLSQGVSKVTSISVSRSLQWGSYLAIVIPIVFLSWKAFLRLDMGDLQHRKIAVCLACLVYALALPRFYDYQWILLLVPTYFIMLRLDVVRAYPAIFILAVLAGEYQTPLPGSVYVFGVVWNYYPLIVAFIIWAMYVVIIQRDFLRSSSQTHDMETATPRQDTLGSTAGNKGQGFL